MSKVKKTTKVVVPKTEEVILELIINVSTKYPTNRLVISEYSIELSKHLIRNYPQLKYRNKILDCGPANTFEVTCRLLVKVSVQDRDWWRIDVAPLLGRVYPATEIYFNNLTIADFKHLTDPNYRPVLEFLLESEEFKQDWEDFIKKFDLKVDLPVQANSRRIHTVLR